MKKVIEIILELKVAAIKLTALMVVFFIITAVIVALSS